MEESLRFWRQEFSKGTVSSDKVFSYALFLENNSNIHYTLKNLSLKKNTLIIYVTLMVKKVNVPHIRHIVV